MLGLGATLINNDKIIAFTSKSLSDAESWYANIESELLQWYLVVKDSTHVYRKEFWIESDHKSLENIQNKNIAQTLPRLQRVSLRLQPYDAKIIYSQGIDMKIPDYLLRTQPTQVEEIELDLSIHTVNISAQKQTDL